MPIRRVPGLASATVLAAVTLGTFAVFQNYGPESAVRRFHRAVATNDPSVIPQIVLTDPNGSAVQDLKRIVAGAVHGGADYRIVKSERSSEQVEMLALYPGGLRIVWVVTKKRGQDRWRINPYLTIQGLRRLGMP